MGLDSYAKHCTTALLLRLAFVVYSNFHDKWFDVPYTDVDYKVFTDAARHVTEGNSPYDRHTYRYTPLLAFLLVPNVIFCEQFGKVIFSVIDILVAILLRRILAKQNLDEKTTNLCGFLWLYNPLSIIVTTRGNADSLAVFFVLLSIYYLQNDKCWLAGIVHGFSIHLRLYPIAFSLSMYLALQKSNKFHLLPSKRQIALVLGCLASLIFWTSTCYYLYGYKFLYESLLYHLIRKDARHNFSVYFYMLYLSADQATSIWQRVFAFLPQFLLLLGLSFRYSSKNDLSFSVFTQAFVMVTYNPVMTSQYFFWFLSLLPLCLPRIKMSIARSVALTLLWISSQGTWLLAAYALEFKGFASFLWIWLASLGFFTVNIKVLADLIRSYDPRGFQSSLKKVT